MDAQRKIKWDDSAVDNLLKQFDDDVTGSEDKEKPESALSQVLSSFKVGLAGRVSVGLDVWTLYV